MDMSQVIIPKSDQLNADDLISGPRTIKITGVKISQGTEQPVSISFEGDGGKPYKACKSMCRVMVAAWGADSSKYAGRLMTLYRDEKVKWAGLEVGGIRISHLSHIDKPMTMALTMTKQSRKPFTVSPLVQEQDTRQKVSDEQAMQLSAKCAEHGIAESWLCSKAKVSAISEIAADDFDRCMAAIKAKAEKDALATQA